MTGQTRICFSIFHSNASFIGSGLERMWSVHDASELALGVATPPDSRVTASLGYGFRAPVWCVLATPSVTFEASGASERERAGVLLAMGPRGAQLELSVERASAYEAHGPTQILRETRYLMRFSMPLETRAAQPPRSSALLRPSPVVICPGG